MTTYTRCDHPSAEERDAITLDVPVFVEADSRHISRLLKAAGVPKAERQPGGGYTRGYHTSGGHLSIYGFDHRGTTIEEETALMDQAVQVLRDAGLTVTGRGTMGRYVFKQVTEVPWSMLHLGVYVGVADYLTPAYNIPAFRAEQQRLHQVAKTAETEAKKATQAREVQADERATEVMDMIDARYGKLTINEYKDLCKALVRRLTTEVAS